MPEQGAVVVVSAAVGKVWEGEVSKLFVSVGISYNEMQGRDRKDMIAEWEQGMYPEAFVELEEAVAA